MRTEKEVLAQFDKWAQGNDLIRAAILTSSRVNPEREMDFLSDYDIVLYVADLQPFRKSDQWLDAFGSIMVRWPRRPLSMPGETAITRLVLFKDGAFSFKLAESRRGLKRGMVSVINVDNVT